MAAADQANATRGAPTPAAIRAAAARGDAQRLARKDRAAAPRPTSAIRCARHIAHVHHQRLSELGAEPLFAGGAPEDAADAGIDARERLAALELGLADREHDEVGVDIGGFGGGDGQVEHGMAADGAGSGG